MLLRRCVALFAALGLLVCAGIARAAGGDSPFAPAPQYMDADEGTPPVAAPPLAIQDGLDRAGIGQQLYSWGFRFFGHVEGSYTYNLTAPGQDTINGRGFDFENEALRMNQIMMTVQRVVDPTAAKFDIGGRIDVLYGSDGRFIHASGLNGYFSKNPINQFDLTQAYLEAVIPVGTGLDLQAGKFINWLGSESIDATQNVFYSHSFQFNFATPATQTGATASYSILPGLNLLAGFSRGWNQCLDSNTGQLSGYGAIKWQIDEDMALTFHASVGPEINSHAAFYQQYYELIFAYTSPDTGMTFGVNPYFAQSPHATATAHEAYWAGCVGYAQYRVADELTINLRAEWMHDEGGTRLPMASFGPAANGTSNIYELSAGVTIQPAPHTEWLSGLKFRPEIRYDYAARGDYFAGGTRGFQVTVAMDAIYAF